MRIMSPFWKSGLLLILLASSAQSSSQGRFSGTIDGKPFDVEVNCSFGITGMAPGAGSFRSDKGMKQDKDYNGDGIVISGQSLDGKKMLVTVIGQGLDTNILVEDYAFDNNVIRHSGEISRRDGTSYSAEFEIDCSTQ